MSATITIDGTEVTITVQEGQPGPGVPTGGLEGQILAKASDVDFDDVWIDPPTESTVTTDATLTGDGSIGSPLSVALALIDGGPLT